MNYKNLIMVVLALALLAGVAQAAQYDFQDAGIGDWTYWGGATASASIIAVPYDDTYILRGDFISSNTISMTPNLHIQIGYVAYTHIDSSTASKFNPRIKFYDSNDDPLTQSPRIFPPDGTRVEVIREGSEFYVYFDGVYSEVHWEPGGTPYNVVFYAEYTYSSGYAQFIEIDDIVIGGSRPDILGTAGDSYFYILNDFDDPTNNGLYNADGVVYTDVFHTTYGVNTQVAQVDEIRIETYHVGTGYTVNTTTIDTSTYPAGVIEYDLDEMFFDDEDAPFGLYIQHHLWRKHPGRPGGRDPHRDLPHRHRLYREHHHDRHPRTPGRRYRV